MQDLRFELVESGPGRRRLDVHDEIDGTEIAATRPAAEDLSDPPLDTMSDHRLLGHLAADGNTQSCLRVLPRSGDAWSGGMEMDRGQSSVSSATSAVAGQEVGLVSEPVLGPQAFGRTRRLGTGRAKPAHDQALRRLRPLRRRRARMAWPWRVRMRTRKPCFFLRRRLFGWNVRFTAVDLLSVVRPCVWLLRGRWDGVEDRRDPRRWDVRCGSSGFAAIGAAGKWRRGRDSNPRTTCAVNGFRDRPVRPLRHLS